MSNKTSLVFLRVTNLNENTTKFVALNRQSGGYPYLSDYPEFYTADFANRMFESLYLNVGEVTGMSDGSKSLHYEISMLGNLDVARRDAVVKLEVCHVDLSGDGKVESRVACTIGMQSGSNPSSWLVGV